MLRRLPERANIDTQKCIKFREHREDETTRKKGFPTFVPKAEIGEHLKAKTLQARKISMAEKLSKTGEKENN